MVRNNLMFEITTVIIIYLSTRTNFIFQSSQQYLEEVNAKYLYQYRNSRNCLYLISRSHFFCELVTHQSIVLTRIMSRINLVTVIHQTTLMQTSAIKIIPRISKTSQILCCSNNTAWILLFNLYTCVSKSVFLKKI